MSTLDTHLPGVPLATPLYRELAVRMRAALAEGEWKPAEAIHAERQLSARFGVSDVTLRKAIAEPDSANLLNRQQRRGTFVASHDRDRMLFYFFHSVPEQEDAKQYTEVRLVSFTRDKADRIEAEHLRI